MMLEYNSDLDIKNKQNLTPLTLAAKLARKEIFQYILERKRQYWFSYADISCGAYPLDTIDTISTNGTTDTTSALFLIANTVCNFQNILIPKISIYFYCKIKRNKKHLELLEGLVVELIDKKWDKYVKQRFYFEFLFFIIHFLVSLIVIIFKKEYYTSDHMNNTCIERDLKYSKLLSDCRCAYLYPSDGLSYVRLVFELVIYLYSIIYLTMFVIELHNQRLFLFMQTLFFNPAKIFLIFSLLSTLLILPMRLSCNVYGEDILVSLTILFKSIFILYLGR